MRFLPSSRVVGLFVIGSLLYAGCAPVQNGGSGSVSSAFSSVTASQAASVAASGTGATTQEPFTNVQYGLIDGKALHGYLAAPASGTGAYPAVILIHQWWGLNAGMRDYAQRFADQGYAALAVDLYDGKVADTQADAQAYATAVRNSTDRALANLRQAVEFLHSRPDVDDARIASVGWCFGGGWAYQMAKNDLDVAATVMYYGQFDPADDFAHMKADIQGHFGEEDQSISVNSVREFEASLRTHNGIHEVSIYPNVGHGFANEENGDAYDPAAAELAWTRTLDFLQRALQSTQGDDR